MDNPMSDDNRAVERWENEGGRVGSVNRPTASLKTFALTPEVDLAERQVVDMYEFEQQPQHFWGLSKVLVL